MDITWYDSVGNELKAGDIVRMYHFTGARGKRHYMYKRFVDYEQHILHGFQTKYYGVFEHLDGSGTFRSHGNEYKDRIVIVQRAKYEDKELKRNLKLRD